MWLTVGLFAIEVSGCLCGQAFLEETTMLPTAPVI